jgi:heptosyltransferase-2
MPARPLVVRLRNWVGDVILGVPALRLLAAQGYSLRLTGKPWACALMAAEGWAIEPLAQAGWRSRVAQLRRLRARARAEDAGFDRRLNTLVLPFSFSSALDARLAGLRALGYAHEGRSPLLARALPRHRGEHELRAYWRIASALTGTAGEPPATIAWAVDAGARERAARRLEAAGIGMPFVVICPFAGGTFEGLDKRWPDFAAFTAAAAREWGLPLVVCPGPGEVDNARREHAAAHMFEGVALDEYAALLERAALMVSNDTGPGHLAAAVGTPLLSVLGPTDAEQWGPWGPSAHVMQRAGGWPTTREVLAAGERLLAQREAA